jgi:hypothetical protein
MDKVIKQIERGFAGVGGEGNLQWEKGTLHTGA